MSSPDVMTREYLIILYISQQKLEGFGCSSKLETVYGDVLLDFETDLIFLEACADNCPWRLYHVKTAYPQIFVVMMPIRGGDIIA